MRQGKVISRGVEGRPVPPGSDAEELRQLVQSKLRSLVGKAGNVFDVLLRVRDAEAEEQVSGKTALWKLRLDAAEKVLKLAGGAGRVGRPPGTAAKAKGSDAEDEPEDGSGVLDGAFPHLRQS